MEERKQPLIPPPLKEGEEFLCSSNLGTTDEPRYLDVRQSRDINGRLEMRVYLAELPDHPLIFTEDTWHWFAGIARGIEKCAIEEELNTHTNN